MCRKEQSTDLYIAINLKLMLKKIPEMPVSLYMYSSDYLCRVRLIHCPAPEAECNYTGAMILQVLVFKLENVSTEVFHVQLLQVVPVHRRLCRLSAAGVKNTGQNAVHCSQFS